MANEVGSNGYFRGARRHRYLILIATALLVVVVLGALAARVRPGLADKYVSRINQGQLQVCRVTPAGVVCPPLTPSLSPSHGAGGSKSTSVSTSTSLSPSVHT
jgi:hypothetical protein